MSKHTLSATSRKLVGRKVKSLRAQGFVPANVFGKNIKSENIQVKSGEFTKLYKDIGESVLVYLSVDGETEPRPVMVHEITLNPITDQVLHIDFHQVDLKEKTTAPVAIKLTGESPAEKDKLGILVQQLNEVEVEALPADMPEAVEASVDSLAAVGDVIHVKDLPVSAKLTIKTDPEAIVAKIEALAKEEVVEVAPAPEGTETPTPVEGQSPASETPEETKSE